MADNPRISDHWGTGDVFGRIVAAMNTVGLSPETVTVEQLAPVDHFHARGFAATVELAEALPIKAGDHLVDIGCGIGGPARYLSKRFGCSVSGLDITEPFVEAANKLTALVGMQDRVAVVSGDGQHLPYADNLFDGGYTQHVTMNVADRARFFAEAFRVLRPGAYFALTEHGLGEKGDPYHPLPWSDDGSGAYLVTPAETVGFLKGAGFVDIAVTDTGPKYLEGYKRAIQIAEQGQASPFGLHILLGKTAPEKTRNAARNIEENRTHPVQITCRKPA